MNNSNIPYLTGGQASPSNAKARSIALVSILALIGALILLDWLLFDRFGQGQLFWRWTKPRPRIPFLLFAGATASSIALFASMFRCRLARLSGRTIFLAAAVAAVPLTACVASYYLRNFPNSGDEYAYYFQALTFEAGRLWNPAPAQGPAVAASFTWVAHNRWVGQYPVGWPALIAAADIVGSPVWLLNAVLLIATGGLLYALIRRDASARAAGLGAAVFLIAPFSLFQAASFFSHLFAGFLVLLSSWAYRRSLGDDRILMMIVAGAAVGMLANTRTSSVLVLAIPLGLGLLIERRWRHLVAFCIGGVPFALAILAYQHAVTGDMLKPVYYFGGRTIDHLYFDAKSIKAGAISTVGKMSELSLWVSPILVPIWLYALYVRIARQRFDAVDAIFPMAMLLFVFYPIEPGNRYGPRYYFEFWPLMLATIATAQPLIRPVIRSWCAAAGIGSILYGLILLPDLGRQYQTIVDERIDPYRQVAAAKIDRGVICVDYDYGALPLGGSDYARNGISADKALLYANCVGHNIAWVHARFPGLPVYYYRHPRGDAAGHLVKL